MIRVPVVTLALVLAASGLARAQQVTVQEHVLRNGMRLLLMPRHEEPSFSGGWVVHVGSADDPPKQSGITHLLEHMMFKGTPTIGRSIKGEFHQIYARYGASELNALTNIDTTTYFVTLPRNKLELWFWMESERLLRPVFRDFATEREVAMEERRQRIESTPLGPAQEEWKAAFWGDHPYGRPVTGWPAELLSLTPAQARDYFRRHYAPAEITAVLVGDFDPAVALALAQRYLGRIPAVPRPAPAPPPPPRKPGSRRFSAEADTPPHLEILCETVPFRHPDSYALQVAAQLLSGRNGRFYHDLDMPGIGVQTSAKQLSYKYSGVFSIEADCLEGRPIDAAERAVQAELLRLQREPVSPRELKQVKNQFAVSAFQHLSGNMQVLQRLLASDGLGDWHEVKDGLQRLHAVTAQDVQRAARTYFTKERCGVARYLRRGPKA